MESTSQNNSINAIKEARKLFNEARSTLSREELNEISYLQFFKRKRATRQFNK